MTPHYLPATSADDPSGWQQTVMAFLAEKERRSGSKRTVEGYARMLWPFLGGFRSPAEVTPAHVLAWAHGRGLSGREPSSATVGARIACLSSYYRFLIRMQVTSANPCDALERPKGVQSVARGLGADEVRRLLAVVPDTVAGRRDRARVRVGPVSSTLGRWYSTTIPSDQPARLVCVAPRSTPRPDPTSPSCARPSHGDGSPAT